MDLGASEFCFTVFTRHGIVMTMPEPRMTAASITVGSQDSMLFITGGTTSFFGLPIASTLLVSPFENATFEGPNMPEVVNKHCFTKITSTKAISVGGENTDRSYKKSSFYYEIQSQKWSTGPSHNGLASRQACNAVQDTIYPDKMLVVVVGGPRVLILDVEANLWRDGAEFPFPSFGNAGMVSLSSAELLLVGSSTEVVISTDSEESSISVSNAKIGQFQMEDQLKSQIGISYFDGDRDQDTVSWAFKIKCFNGECIFVQEQFEYGESTSGTVTILVPEHLTTCKEEADIHHSDKTCPEESKDLISNGNCEDFLDTPACYHDGGDCITTKTTTTITAAPSTATSINLERKYHENRPNF